MNGNNGKKMGTVLFAVVIMFGMALMGMFVPAAADGDVVEDNQLVESASLDPVWAFSTSTVDIDISYSLATVDSTLELSNLNITVEEEGSATAPVLLYNWNSTTTMGMLMNPYVWSLDGTQEVGDWIITVEADYFNLSSGAHHIGSKEANFQVLDGTHVIQEISADPATVDNSGMDMVNVSLMFNRNFNEIDMEETMVSFFHVDTMQWVDDEVLDLEPDPENITNGDHNATAWTLMTIPENLPVGEYKLYFNLFDIWGYNESYNETLFNVIWGEQAPEMINDTIFMHEDEVKAVDLDDHFDDLNGQELTYYINLSAVEILTIVFTDEHSIEISAPMDWNGEQTFDIAVTDGIDMPGHNETFTMTVMVAEAPDDLRAAEDLTIEVDEVEMEASFNPQDLFYDPDGPAEYVVSLGWEWALNETNVSVMTPIWTWEDLNFSVSINDTDNTDGMVMVLADLEEGSVEFPVSAWMNGTPILNATAMVEIVPVNDVPAPKDDTITVYKNDVFTGNLSALFEDPDSTVLNFTVNATMAENIQVDYDWMTFGIVITPDENWTGTTTFKVNATDGVDYMEYTMTVEVILRSYTVTGTVDFEEIAGVEVNLTNVTLMIGETEIVIEDDGSFSVVLPEGDYDVTLDIPEDLLYSEEDEMSGYVIPTLDPINLTADETYDITVSYMEYESATGEASWDNLDFENVEFDDDDDLMVILPVKEGSENSTGWATFVVKLIIVESDDEKLNFTMTWDTTDKRFTITLTDDDLEDLGDGKKAYYFSNENGSLVSEEEKYEFKSEDENAGPMTIIILVALILLVLVALIFIMRKPSEEDFDEDEEEEEEEGRTCPGCGETVTDDEAEECPYCGEDLEGGE